jgi:antitoxin component of MazEF toxin-antitoxin module
MTEVKLRRTGYTVGRDGTLRASYALTVPAAIVSALGFREGDRFRVEIVSADAIKFVRVR